MSIRNVLRKAASLVIEIPEDSPSSSASPLDSVADEARASQSRTIEDVVAQSPGPNLDQIQVPAEVVKESPMNPDGTPNFTAIYSLAGVPPVPFGASEALSVIQSLPADLPLEVKRKTVGATLSAMGKSMGVNTESVVSDASRKVAALASFEDQFELHTQEYTTKVNEEIAKAEAQIAHYRTMIEAANTKLAGFKSATQAESDLMDDVLEFFTLDVGASKHAT